MKNLKAIKSTLNNNKANTSELLSDQAIKSLKGGYKGDPPPYID